jgi:hypothetical protein
MAENTVTPPVGSAEPLDEPAPTAVVQVLKLTAAQRQLDAAIRMWFAGEDALAIHTVAYAAYGILRDLKAKRSGSVMAEEFKHNWLSVARRLVRGELTAEQLRRLKEAPETWRMVCWLAEEVVKRYGADKKISKLAAHVGVDIPRPVEKQHWDDFNRVANFLKHANREDNATISEDEADPTMVLMGGCRCFRTGEAGATGRSQRFMSKRKCLPRRSPRASGR